MDKPQVNATTLPRMIKDKTVSLMVLTEFDPNTIANTTAALDYICKKIPAERDSNELCKRIAAELMQSARLAKNTL